MTERELKRLRRADLLEMMLTLTKENEDLRRQLAQVQQQLTDRTLAIEQMGSLAEASLQLNGVFEAAQAACDQYVHNIRHRSENIEQICAQMEQEAQARCDHMIAEAQALVDAKAAEVRQLAQAQTEDAHVLAQARIADAKQQMEAEIAEIRQQAEAQVAEAQRQAEEAIARMQQQMDEQIAEARQIQSAPVPVEIPPSDAAPQEDPWPVEAGLARKDWLEDTELDFLLEPDAKMPMLDTDEQWLMELLEE